MSRHMSTNRPTIELAPTAFRTAAPARDEGFIAEAVSPNLARRQLNVSLGVLGLIAAAGVTIAATFGAPAPPSPDRAVARATVQQPQFVRPMTAERVVSPTGG